MNSPGPNNHRPNEPEANLRYPSEWAKGNYGGTLAAGLGMAIKDLVCVFPALSKEGIVTSPSERRRENILQMEEALFRGEMSLVGMHKDTPVGLEALRQSERELHLKILELLDKLPHHLERYPNAGISKEWFRFAGEDFGDAVLLGDEGGRRSRNALYLTQQAVEKALKGLIILVSNVSLGAREIRKHGHNLDALLPAVAEALDESLLEIATEVSTINPQSIRHRYPDPGVPGAPSEGEVTAVFSAAKVAMISIIDLAHQQLEH